MGSNKIERGQIVSVTHEYENFYGVVEYLKMKDGTILNVHDDVITGYGERNTRVDIFVRLLYPMDKYTPWWSDVKAPDEFDGKTVIPINPHSLYIITDEEIDVIENRWNDKMTFLKNLKTFKPQINEINISK